MASFFEIVYRFRPEEIQKVLQVGLCRIVVMLMVISYLCMMVDNWTNYFLKVI